MYANGERESAKGGSNSNRDSIPDWVPYAESSVANKSSRDLSHSHNADELLVEFGLEREALGASTRPGIAREQSSKFRRKRFQRKMQGLWKLPSFLRRSSEKQEKRKRSQRPSWRTDEITEEFSISVPPLEEINLPFE